MAFPPLVFLHDCAFLCWKDGWCSKALSSDLVSLGQFHLLQPISCHIYSDCSPKGQYPPIIPWFLPFLPSFRFCWKFPSVHYRYVKVNLSKTSFMFCLLKMCLPSAVLYLSPWHFHLPGSAAWNAHNYLLLLFLPHPTSGPASCATLGIASFSLSRLLSTVCFRFSSSLLELLLQFCNWFLCL